MDRVTLDREWWVDKDGSPVPFGSPSGVLVLYGIGAVVPASVAASLKVIEHKSIEQGQAEDKAIRAPAANKAIRSPRATK